AAWMDDCGIDRAYVRELKDAFTAQGYITSDLDGNQITSFHPGAMAYDAIGHLPADTGAKLGVVAPDGAQPMWRASEYCADHCLPFLWDPGQFMTSLDSEEMARFVDAATWIAVNRYESELLCRGTGRTIAELSRDVEALIVTHGADGSSVWQRGASLEVPAVSGVTALDPTGGGDAYRAGLVLGLLRDADWRDSARLASVLGALAVESHGTQNHRPDRDIMIRRFETTYESPWIW
ncbi:MAG: PfkB family carbohydrate kinase, partial [Pseudomonadota bacterium]